MEFSSKQVHNKFELWDREDFPSLSHTHTEFQGAHQETRCQELSLLKGRTWPGAEAGYEGNQNGTIFPGNVLKQEAFSHL